ncbi:hypothetical protein TSTA_048010 [Talaromyces stipitatus ATCC 10500]|uniref:Uncharacterized protein n=1 Tax=Talaromyces stipitatus (strain ATCC 10500 / CBS 375.48 / QM 6759 / NRRL 1006) TaxID=441959 RepID=B8MKK2_TALSN|nr:uncharacterized protein TSTA_048010 [Talaromyces stipitatus ATCC 10500]EED15357.1 hypothetical protein TSTA_048010 [Talaromyces stipitatus ATCC 10500]
MAHPGEHHQQMPGNILSHPSTEKNHGRLFDKDTNTTIITNKPVVISDPSSGELHFIPGDVTHVQHDQHRHDMLKPDSRRMTVEFDEDGARQELQEALQNFARKLDFVLTNNNKPKKSKGKIHVRNNERMEWD